MTTITTSEHEGQTNKQTGVDPSEHLCMHDAQVIRSAFQLEVHRHADNLHHQLPPAIT